jgi:transposase
MMRDSGGGAVKKAIKKKEKDATKAAENILKQQEGFSYGSESYQKEVRKEKMKKQKRKRNKKDSRQVLTFTMKEPVEEVSVLAVKVEMDG